MANVFDPTSFLLNKATASKPKANVSEVPKPIIMETPSLPNRATRQQLAEYYNVSQSTVSRRLNKQGYDLPRGGKVSTTTKKFGEAFSGLELPKATPTVEVDLPETATITDLTKTYKASHKTIKNLLDKEGSLKGSGDTYTKDEYRDILNNLPLRRKEATKQEVQEYKYYNTYIHYKDLLSILGYNSFSELYSANPTLFAMLIEGPYAGNQAISNLTEVIKVVPEQYHSKIIKEGV